MCPTLVSWSGGKDSALALEALRADPSRSVEALVTTITDDFDRISMHGVRRELLVAQAAALDLPLVEVRIPKAASNAVYEETLARAIEPFRARGVEEIVFGDLFLEDVRAYRERFLQGIGMKGLFPLWGRDTRTLATEWAGAGHVAIVVCVDPRRLAGRFAGRTLDHDFLAELPPEVDPCGELGEFHTFVAKGPGFRGEIPVAVGAVAERDGFVFADLAPAIAGAAA